MKAKLTKEQREKGWRRKFKGSPERGGAYIYTHPSLDRAIVLNGYGVSYNGLHFNKLEDAINSVGDVG